MAMFSWNKASRKIFTSSTVLTACPFQASKGPQLVVFFFLPLRRVTRDHSSDVSYEYFNHTSLECFSVTVFPCLVTSAWPKFIQVTLKINTGFLDKSVLCLVCFFSNSEKSRNESWPICWTRKGFACRAEAITSSHCRGTKMRAAALRFSI